jgi:hypothetical protein
MFKFVMSAGLALASLAGISSVGKTSEANAPVQASELRAEYGTVTVDGPFYSRSAAIVFGETCLDLGARRYLAEQHSDGWYVAVQW